MDIPLDKLEMLTSVIESLPTGEREIRQLRKVCQEFDKFIGAIYKFVHVDKIRAKAVRMATKVPRHVRKARGHPCQRIAPKSKSRQPDVGPTDTVEAGEIMQDGHRSCYMCYCRLFEHNASVDHCWFCRDCNALNKHYLEAPLNLVGKFCIVTGGRIKVGFHIALRLLRAGATVAVSSRFPADTLRRYQDMADYGVWRGRLHIIGADFRSLALLEKFIERICELTSRVDILVNNAAQTVRRPAMYYKHLVAAEASPECSKALATWAYGDMPLSVTMNVEASGPLDICKPEDFPVGRYDIDGQQLDLRRENSWTQTIGKVHIAECVETQIINSIAPFYLIQQLESMLQDSVIINITSAEGRKNPRFSSHPHNNMSKAALNMLTQTIAREYMRVRSTLVLGVDTGWANIMVGETAMAKLTYDDSAARAVQPLIDIARDPRMREEYSGKLMRNFKVVPW